MEKGVRACSVIHVHLQRDRSLTFNLEAHRTQIPSLSRNSTALMAVATPQRTNTAGWVTLKIPENGVTSSSHAHAVASAIDASSASPFLAPDGMRQNGRAREREGEKHCGRRGECKYVCVYVCV